MTVIAYHGTTAGMFDVFSPKMRRGEQFGFGVHFASDPLFAQRYAVDPQVARRGKAPALYTCELAFSKLLMCCQIVLEGTPEYDLGKRLAGSKAITHRDEHGRKCLWLQNAIDATSPERAFRLLVEAGYDGLAYESRVGTRPSPGGHSYVSARSLSFVALDTRTIRIIACQTPVAGQFGPLADAAPAARTMATRLSGTAVRDDEDQPLVVYYTSPYETKPAHGSMRLRSMEAISVDAGNISAALADIRNPFVDCASPDLGLGHLRDKLGTHEMMRIALKFAPLIETTEAWSRVRDEIGVANVRDLVRVAPNRMDSLAIKATTFFEDAEEVQALRRRGYDGAIHWSEEPNAWDREFRVFDSSQIVPFSPDTPLPVRALYRDLLLSVVDGQVTSPQQPLAPHPSEDPVESPSTRRTPRLR